MPETLPIMFSKSKCVISKNIYLVSEKRTSLMKIKEIKDAFCGNVLCKERIQIHMRDFWYFSFDAFVGMCEKQKSHSEFALPGS